jgi:uncharacterized protein YbjT (DUF2867 family)
MAKKAIIVGASGLIGSKLLTFLLTHRDYEDVLSVSRKKARINNGKLAQLVIDFDELAEHANALKGDVIFCCLGSTKKQTPDMAEYRKIDHDYPVELAKIALANGITQYHLISAIGANPDSSNFYAKMKGETEKDIIALGLNCLHIYQPSLLTGHRKQSRLLERIATQVMRFINPLLIGGLKKYRSIPAYTVARAMFKQSLKNKTGVFIYPSDKIKQLS